MHLSILLWGATGVLGRAIDLNEGLLVWYRLIICVVSLFVYIKLTNRSLIVPLTQLKKLWVVGTLLMIHWVCFYGGIKYANVSITLSLLSATSLFTAMIEPLVIKEKKFSAPEMFYSTIAMAGIFIIFFSDENSYTTGIIFGVMAAFMGAFFNILNKDVVRQTESSVVSFYEILAGLLMLTVLLPFYILLHPPAKLLPDPTDWLLLTVLAVCCTHITLILSLNALRYLSAFTLNLALNLEPLYGIALAFIIYQENEYLNVWFFTGAGLIILSVMLHSYSSALFNKQNSKK
jgi:drug/metabolite transporter (DMT)-like permease